MKELQIGNIPDLPFDMTEALNQFRINLGFCGDQIKTIMMTSSVPDEGKSFLTMYLWKMIAELGSQTLLIDCDLRNSEMRRTCGISSNDAINSVVHYLAGKAELQNCVYATNVPNGYMIPVTSTVANPTILLEGPRFNEMLEACARTFDYVIVDTPPLANVADALNIATHCDGTVLVVRSGETPRKLVDNSVQMLRRTETPLLGIVLNRVDMDARSSSYYRRYYHSGDYAKNYGLGRYASSGKNK